LIYSGGGFREGSAFFSEGRLAISQNPDEDSDVKGIILPRTVNCHTHIGDAFIQRPAKCSVEELVAPPDGLKHRLLRNASEREQVPAMKDAIRGMELEGVSHYIDFRESGLEGVRRLLMASLGCGVSPGILGRPEAVDANEVSALLSVADGLGISAISDFDSDSLLNLSEHARSMCKIVALHASESRREDFSRILELEPDLLVHMVKSSKADMEACAAAKVPVAICPTSNSFFGLKPPVREMLDAGIAVCIGSDNAMLSSPGILGEVRALRTMFSERELTDSEIMDMAFEQGRKVLNSLPGLRDAYLEHKEFFVIEAPVDDPFKRILEARAEKIHLFDRGETT
jgi:cytosine/adenosine deaminase-related metal-dependent hydrolase